MGCGCCKSSSSEVKDASSTTKVKETATKATVTGGNVAVVAGGVAVGTLVGGPIGAAIGAVIGLAAVGTIGALVKQPDGLLTDLWRGLCVRPELLCQLPKVGLLRIDRGGAPQPPAVSDAMMEKEVNSALFSVVAATVRGIDLATLRSGAELTGAQQRALAEAIGALQSKGCIAITADSGAFIHYQREAAAHTGLPVLLSPLLQAPILVSSLSSHETILTITCDSSVFTQADLEATLTKHGLADSEATAKRFVLRGCEHIPGFAGVDGPFDLAAAQTGLIDVVKEAAKEQQGLGRPIGAILLESAMLPAFSDVLRSAFPHPCFDNFTLSDFAHKACTDNPRFGVSFGPKRTSAKELDPSSMPSMGILRIDYTYPPALGDAAHPNSYCYQTPHATVTGLTFEAAQAGGPLTPAQHDAMAKAVAQLESQGVVGIAGDCGFMMHYQSEARALCKVPCFVSALLQASMLASIFARDELILVLTANGPALQQHVSSLLRDSGVKDEADQQRFIVAGCQDLPGFEAVALGEEVDVAKVQPHMVALVRQRVKQAPKIRAVLLECTELPPYADAIREATKLPVLDSITLVDYFHAAISENPYFGVDWEQLASTPAQASPDSPKTE